MAIEGADLKIDGDGEATVTLEAGEYIIYCTIPCGGGHEEMTAKLICRVKHFLKDKNV
ncbi:hypothetical protein [Halalkalibacter lacteus]|uniref:hypothetical protein n=1 Tax=Halalkalibacter lacteus TaxID=3090663 RepID=UPI002FCB20A0